MDKTLKQKFRQPFGFYMENLIGKYFSLNGVFTMYNAHSHAYEWGLDIKQDELKQLKFLTKILNRDTGVLKNHLLETLRDKNANYEPNEGGVKKSILSLNDSEEMIDIKSTLLTVSSLVSSNTIEFLRIQGSKLIVSEVKSQYGPKPDFRIEFESGQLQKLLRAVKFGLNVSLIYCIALPVPRFVEIPFKALYDKFRDFSDFNGEEFTSHDWPDLRIRIPIEFRSEKKFTKINQSLYDFIDEMSLFRSILDSFPNKFSRLEKFLD